MAGHHNEKLLKHMGIQVWYARGSQVHHLELQPRAEPAVDVVGSQPPVDSPPASGSLSDKEANFAPEAESVESAQQTPAEDLPTYDAFAFQWISAGGVMLLYDVNMTVPDHFVQDLHAYMIWLRRKKVEAVVEQLQTSSQHKTTSAKTSADTFRWPVLSHATTKGSPARTVKVFFDKQLGTGKTADTLLALTAPVAQTLAEWLPQGVLTVPLPNLETCALDPAQKKELWKRLQNML